MNREVYTIAKKLGKNIKLERVRQDLSQEKLAAMAEVSLVAFGAIEAGKSSPKVDTVGKIAKALKIDLYKLFIFE